MRKKKVYKPVTTPEMKKHWYYLNDFKPPSNANEFIKKLVSIIRSRSNQLTHRFNSLKKEHIDYRNEKKICCIVSEVDSLHLILCNIIDETRLLKLLPYQRQSLNHMLKKLESQVLITQEAEEIFCDAIDYLQDFQVEKIELGKIHPSIEIDRILYELQILTHDN